jgi:hypothetical protein
MNTLISSPDASAIEQIRASGTAMIALVTAKNSNAGSPSNSTTEA